VGFATDAREILEKMSMPIGNTAQITVCINTLALAVIRQANFHHPAQAGRWISAHIPQAFVLLLTPVS